MIFKNLCIAAFLSNAAMGNLLTSSDMGNTVFGKKSDTDYFYPGPKFEGEHCHLVVAPLMSPPNPKKSVYIESLSCGMGNNKGTYIHMVTDGLPTGDALDAKMVAKFGGDWDSAVKNVKQAAALMKTAGIDTTPYDNLRRLDVESKGDPFNLAAEALASLKEKHTLSTTSLRAESFVKSTGNGWYYPSSSSRPHVHVSIQVDSAGNRYVDYVGLTNGGSTGAITDLVKSGKMTMNSISQTNWDLYEDYYCAALDVMELASPRYVTDAYRPCPVSAARTAIAQRLSQLLDI